MARREEIHWVVLGDPPDGGDWRTIDPATCVLVRRLDGCRYPDRAYWVAELDKDFNILSMSPFGRKTFPAPAAFHLLIAALRAEADDA